MADVRQARAVLATPTVLRLRPRRGQGDGRGDQEQPVGFDLGQLVAGETQLGRGPQNLVAVDEACVAAYARGMAQEGQPVDEAVLRRAHALQLFLLAGVSSLPGREEMPAGQLAQRARLARLSVDLLDA